MRAWLRDIRKGQRKTQADVAKEAGISVQLYSRTESTGMGPSVSTAKKIASALGFDWTRFFEE